MRQLRILNKEFASRLQLLMEKSGTTQSILAKAVGGSQGLIGHYLNGRCNPSEIKILKMSAFFNVPPEWLRYGTGYIAANSSSLEESLSTQH